MSRRILLQPFMMGIRIYANAKVTAWLADGAGQITDVKATLFADPYGTVTIENPQQLDSEGKLGQPVYHQDPIIVTVDGLAVGTHETGVIRPIPDSAFPWGPAGGDLDGFYPDPTLVDIGPGSVTGNATHVSRVTVDTKGRVIDAVEFPIAFPPTPPPSGPAGGDLAGYYPNPILNPIGSVGTAGDGTHVAQVTIDTKGRVTSLTSVAIAVDGTPIGPAGGDLAGTYPNPTLAAIVPGGSAGDATHVAALTVDTKGRVVGLASVAINFPPTAPSGPAGGDLAGTYPNPTVAPDAITNAKLANMAQATVKGRQAGAGPGDPQDLTQADLIAIIGSTGGPTMATTANKTNVAASIAAVTLLAANATRLGASIYNDSAAELLVCMGAGASATNFSVDMLPGSYLEVPANYVGVISGIWAAATGFARVTEYVP